jgi:hypothetical protein
MQGIRRKNFDAVIARAPVGMLGGLASSRAPGAAGGLITSRKDAGRSMRTGVFFGGADHANAVRVRRVYGIH